VYATAQDVLNRSEVNAAEDSDVLQLAIEDASAFIDGHLAGRYGLPLGSAPAILTTLAVDIAIYNLARDDGMLTEDIRKRFEDAKSYLRAVARGEIRLPGLEDRAAHDGPGLASFASSPRRFWRR
jgi:phage gp36-like protein